MDWLGGNSEALHSTISPVISYVVKLRHKGLRPGSYTEYQTAISNEVLRLRDVEKLTFNDIAQLLILEGWNSPRGFDLGPESIFSIYKKRKIRDARLLSPPEIEILGVTVQDE